MTAATELRAKDAERLAALDLITRLKGEVHNAGLQAKASQSRARQADEAERAARGNLDQAKEALDLLLGPRLRSILDGDEPAGSASAAPDCTAAGVAMSDHVAEFYGRTKESLTEAQSTGCAAIESRPPSGLPITEQELEVWLLAYRCEREASPSAMPDRARQAASDAVKALRELAGG